MGLKRVDTTSGFVPPSSGVGWGLVLGLLTFLGVGAAAGFRGGAYVIAIGAWLVAVAIAFAARKYS
jgi:hypothetical protein